jgi:hypothetical protein
MILWSSQGVVYEKNGPGVPTMTIAIVDVGASHD